MSLKKNGDEMLKLKAEIVEESGREMPRMDLIIRKIGRYNRLKGRHLHQSILHVIGKPGAQKIVDALLSDNR